MNAAPKEKSEKVVVLFLPEELLRRFTVLHLLYIQKTDKGIGYTVSPISRQEVQRHFSALPEVARSLLLKFQPGQLENLVKEAELRYKKQKAGIALSLFRSQSVLRFLHQQFGDLKPYYTGLKCYHKIRKPGSQIFQTLPCRFDSGKPRLHFAATRAENLYSLQTEIELNGTLSRIDDFVRTAFFLQKDNVYFLLSFKDYQTLEWLEENLLKQAGLEQEVFVEKILRRIEEEYPVNRNHLLDEKQIEAVPTCRVLLSELNGSFLLLTPHRLYDGMVEEGSWKEKQEVSANGKRLGILRHQETERQFLQLLSSFHPGFTEQRNGYYYLSFAQAQKGQWFLKTYYRLLEIDVEVAGMDLLQHFRYSPHKAETTMTVQREEGSRAYISMSVRFGKELVSLPALQKALYAGQRAIVLKDGSLGVLSDEWLEKYATIVKHGKVQDGGVHVSKFLALSDRGEAEDGTAFKPHIQKEWWERWKKWQSSEEPLFALPATVKAELRPYQR